MVFVWFLLKKKEEEEECIGVSFFSVDECEKRKGGWHTRKTPGITRTQDKTLTTFSLSFKITAERTNVTIGLEYIILKASGTGMKLTLARLAMKKIAPARPI